MQLISKYVEHIKSISDNENKDGSNMPLLKTLECKNPFVLISKYFHHNDEFLNKTIYEIYDSYINDFIKYQPYKVNGYLKSIGVFKINSQTLYWEFSSLDGMLMTYKSIEDHPIKYKNLYQLSALNDVRITNNYVSKKSSKSKSCFEINGKNISKNTFYSLNKSI